MQFLENFTVASDSRRILATTVFDRHSTNFGHTLSKTSSDIISVYELNPAHNYPQRYITPSVPKEHIGFTQVHHCKVPNYTSQIYADIVRLCKEYHNRQSATACTRQEFDSHERIDLTEFNGKVGCLKHEIESCQKSKDTLVRRQWAYRADGMWQNMFICNYNAHINSATIHAQEIGLIAA